MAGLEYSAPVMRLRSWIGRLLWWQALLITPVVGLRLTLSAAGLTRTEPDADEIRVASIGDGLVLNSEATAFSGGAIAWIISGMVLDFRGATLARTGADLRIVSVMSGTVIRLPASWDYSLDQTNVFSGSVPQFKEAAGEQVLRIKATSILSGFRVVRQDEEDEA